VRTGLTDEIIAQLDDYEHSDLEPAWIAALQLTDHLSGDPQGEISVELYEELRRHFGEQDILMLGALLSIGSGWQRMIEAFGIRPDHFEATTAAPWATAAD